MPQNPEHRNQSKNVRVSISGSNTDDACGQSIMPEASLVSGKQRQDLGSLLPLDWPILDALAQRYPHHHHRPITTTPWDEGHALPVQPTGPPDLYTGWGSQVAW